MLRLLVAATALAGALLPWVLPRADRVDPVIATVLALLAVVAGMRCVKPSGRSTWFVPTDAFVLAGIVTVGGRVACLLALAGLLGMVTGLRGRLALARGVFNAGAVLVATVAAATCFLSLANPAAAYVVAAAAFFLVNTALVTTAVSLDRSKGWLATWRSTFLPAAPRFALAALLGALLAGMASWGAGYVLLLGSVPCLSATLALMLTSPR